MKSSILDLNKNDFLFRELQQAIRLGQFPAGARIPTERELAEHYHCSRVTVRNSLRRLKALRFIERIRGSGTSVLPDTGRKRQLCYRIAFFLEENDIFRDDDPYFARLLSGLVLREQLPCFPEFHPVTSRDEFPWSGLDPADYAGFVAGFQLTPAECGNLRELGIPFLSLQEPEAENGSSCVAVDNYAGVCTATEHLLSAGRRDPLFLTGSARQNMNRNKIRGFLDTLARAGIAPEAERRIIEIVPSDEIMTDTVIRRELPERGTFDSLLIHGDWATWATVHYLREKLLRIPDDVSVVMYDEFSWVSRSLKLELTAVRQPHAEQLRRALNALLRQIEQPASPQVIQTIQPTLVVRDSSIPPRRNFQDMAGAGESIKKRAADF